MDDFKVYPVHTHGTSGTVLVAGEVKTRMRTAAIEVAPA